MKTSLYLVLILSAFTACERGEHVEAPPEDESASVADTMRAVATLEPASGSELSGEAFFVQQGKNEIHFGVFIP